MATQAKTPVTNLQELCLSRKAGAPIYECIGEDIVDASLPSIKIFKTQVQALGYTSEGLGRSKKDSKHDAASRLLKKLMHCGDDDEMDVDDDQQLLSVLQSDKVTEVRDICIQRNFPVPEFRCVRTSGPSHAPEFEFECRIDTIVRRGIHKTKKGAKQAACNEMIKTLQAMPVDETLMQVQSLDKVADMDMDDNDNTIRTYREYKNSDIKKKLGVKICDRHKYFEELEPSKIASARLIFSDETINKEDKCTLIPKALGLKYDMKLEDSLLRTEIGQKLYCFELLNTEYDCYIFGLKNEFFKRVYDYFKNMLNFDYIRD